MTADTMCGHVQEKHVLKSYLDSMGIPYASASDLVIVSKSSAPIRVSFIDEGFNEVVDDTVKMKSTSLLSNDVDEILQTLHVLTEAAGYGKPNPLDRGTKSAQRISYHDDYESVYLRHQLFRRTPNPTASRLAMVEELMPIVRRTAAKAQFQFRTPLNSMGFHLEDLVSIGRMHTIAFLHHYAYSVEQVDNIKLLTEYLNQRFAELAKVTYKKAASATCMPGNAVHRAGATHPELHSTDHEDVFDRYVNWLSAEIETTAASDEYESGSYRLVARDGSERRLDIEADGFMGIEMYVNDRLLASSERDVLRERVSSGILTIVAIDAGMEDPVETGPSLNVRKTRARKELHNRFMDMDVDQREALLGYAAMARDYCPDARSVARKLCDELACPQCDRKVTSGTHCPRCRVEAKLRYGVDYLAFKNKLRSEHNLLAEGMTASIPEGELRAKQRREADALVPKNENTAPMLSAEEIDALVKRYRDECFDALPAELVCTNCGGKLPKKAFGVRVPRRKSDGMPQKASRIPWCKTCRKKGKS